MLTYRCTKANCGGLMFFDDSVRMAVSMWCQNGHRVELDAKGVLLVKAPLSVCEPTIRLQRRQGASVRAIAKLLACPVTLVREVLAEELKSVDTGSGNATSGSNC